MEIQEVEVVQMEEAAMVVGEIQEVAVVGWVVDQEVVTPTVHRNTNRSYM